MEIDTVSTNIMSKEKIDLENMSMEEKARRYDEIILKTRGRIQKWNRSERAKKIKRDYMKTRYHTDPEYRERCMKYGREYARKRKVERR